MEKYDYPYGYDLIYRFVKMLSGGSDTVDTNLDVNNKIHLFSLGVMFAAGKKINLKNKSSFKLDGPKSFEKMAYQWEKERRGVILKNENDDQKAFLICSVRNADEELKKDLMKKVEDLEKNYIVYYPARDTNQIDDTGYRICKDNANAISNAKHIFINYSRESVGTIFDLGVAYYFQLQNMDRTFEVLNKDEFVFNEKDFGDIALESFLNLQKKEEKSIVREKGD